MCIPLKDAWHDSDLPVSPQTLNGPKPNVNWDVTILPGGPKWCELFLILYHTPYYTQLKVNKTDVVTVIFRIFTFQEIILNPVTVAKHLVVLIVIVYSCAVIFAKTKSNAQRLIATNNCSGRYTEIVTGHYFSIVARYLLSPHDLR